MDELDLLVAEPVHERHVLIRRRDEAGVDPGLVGAVPLGGRHLLVLATPGAHEVPSLVSALPALLSDFVSGIDTVWVGVGGLATAVDALGWLAGQLGVEVVAPDGGVAAMPGAAMYAGHGAGGTGWYSSGQLVGARLPVPEWESWLPDSPLEVGGGTGLPVPCGLALSGDVSGGGGHEVPVNQRFPKLVVGAPVPSPADVAALLGGLPDRPVMIVPATPEPATHPWLAELAMRLDREVVFSAGTQVRTRSGALSTFVPDADGNRLFRPFPLVLSQPPRGGDQQVLDIAAAPPGWERAGRQSYRLTAGGAVADVVPSGLVLRSEDGYPDDSPAPFDPGGWTLTIGVRGQVVGLPVLAAAEGLLAVLPEGQRAAVRVRMAGVMDQEAERALDRWAGAREPAPAAVSVSEVDPPGSARVTGPGDGAHRPPVVTISGAPVSTVSTAPEVTPPAVSRAPAPPGRSLAVSNRASTASEQARFASAAGDSFVEALATVNAAMATWPSIRDEQSQGAKADYVAVCLFLGRGDAGAGAVNDAVRVGRAGVLDGQVPCLVSGIRRLPTHRRAVLRQGKVTGSLEHRSTPGSVLTEPGFLAGSTDLDVTVPGADLDVLIWPSTARRTSELLVGRPLGEAVFLAGARFKTLAVRTADEDEQEDPGGPVAPKVAVLFRELAPGETSTTTELDERDLAVLAKLDSVLARRHRGPLRLVEDTDVVARLTTSMVAWRREAATAAVS
jgi:hypothetical protein